MASDQCEHCLPLMQTRVFRHINMSLRRLVKKLEQDGNEFSCLNIQAKYDRSKVLIS